MYYELCPRHKGSIRAKIEKVEYSISELIILEAECFADTYAEDDAQWQMMMSAKEMEIWHELESKGIWCNEAGRPRFIKLEGNQTLKLED